MAGKPQQADAAGSAGGEGADGPVGDRGERSRRKPRKPSAARQQKLNEHFEQKRLKAKLLMVLPQVRLWAERMAAHPAQAACSVQECSAIIAIASAATGGSTAIVAAPPGATELPMCMEAEKVEAEQEKRSKREREAEEGTEKRSRAQEQREGKEGEETHGTGGSGEGMPGDRKGERERKWHHHWATREVLRRSRIRKKTLLEKKGAGTREERKEIACEERKGPPPHAECGSACE